MPVLLLSPCLEDHPACVVHKKGQRRLFPLAHGYRARRNRIAQPGKIHREDEVPRKGSVRECHRSGKAHELQGHLGLRSLVGGIAEGIGDLCGNGEHNFVFAWLTQGKMEGRGRLYFDLLGVNGSHLALVLDPEEAFAGQLSQPQKGRFAKACITHGVEGFESAPDAMPEFLETVRTGCEYCNLVASFLQCLG